MPDPKITNVREIGRTTDTNRFAVNVERTAWLDENLTTITARSIGRIHLIAHAGYNDAQSWSLDPQHARALMIALENALDDLKEAERFDAELIEAQR